MFIEFISGTAINYSRYAGAAGGGGAPNSGSPFREQIVTIICCHYHVSRTRAVCQFPRDFARARALAERLKRTARVKEIIYN